MSTITINKEFSELFGITVNVIEGYDLHVQYSGGAYYSLETKEVYYSKALELGSLSLLLFILAHEVGHSVFGRSEELADKYAQDITGYSAISFREEFDFNNSPYREYMISNHEEGYSGFSYDLLCLEMGIDPRPVFGPEPHPLDGYSQYLQEAYGYYTLRECLNHGLTQEEIDRDFEEYIGGY